MRFFGALIAILFILWPGCAAAYTLRSSRQIYIRAVVPASEIIVVDNSGRILEIMSNSDSPTEKLVYKGNIATDTKTDLTADIDAQYEKIMFQHALRVGLLYRAATKPTSAGNKTALLTMSNLLI